jgi:AcrR family transcriptional regulator
VKRVPSRARRDELSDRLRDFILENGFAHVCLDELASWLQCSKATLYGIAPGKKSLVTAVLEEFLREVVAVAEERAADVADPAGRLTAYLAAIGAETGRMSAACYADVTSHDTTGDVYHGHVDTVAGRLYERIDQGMRDGEFRPAHARFLAEAAAMITDANAHGGLPGRAGLTVAEAQSQLGDLLAATLSNTDYQKADLWPETGRPEFKLTLD